ncbi:MAG: flavoprotein, partial [Acidimicrobiales bacterium]
VLPSTAHSLAEAALGLASGRTMTTVLASQQPVVFLPSMNEQMWRNPAVQRNVDRLRSDGHHIVDPVQRNVYSASRREAYVGTGIPPPPDVVRFLREIVSERFSGCNHSNDLPDTHGWKPGQCS